jgi:hypothetical protein
MPFTPCFRQPVALKKLLPICPATGRNRNEVFRRRPQRSKPQKNTETIMRQLLFGTAAIGLALALTTSANAGERPSSSHNGGNHNDRGDHRDSRRDFDRDSRRDFDRDSRRDFDRDSRRDFRRDFDRDDHRGYHEIYGSRFKDGGYYYRGHDHNHWTYSYWYGRYGCYTYWCPYTSCWYYWYPTTQCYYPVSYLPTYTPTPSPAPVGVSSKVTQIVNVNNDSPGSVVGDGPGPRIPPGPPSVPLGPSVPAGPSVPPGAPMSPVK